MLSVSPKNKSHVTHLALGTSRISAPEMCSQPLTPLVCHLSSNHCHEGWGEKQQPPPLYSL